jgi:hypothetical protein
MATTSELELALVEFVQQNTYELRYRSNEQSVEKVAPQVYRGYVRRDQVGAIVAGDISVYPAVIVRAKSGVQDADNELVVVEIIVGTFDDALDQQGYVDCLQLVERLMQRFREQSILRQRFPLRLPLNWQLHKHYDTHQNNFPYFFGEMQIQFWLRVMTSQYDKGAMDGDLTPGRYDVPHFYDENDNDTEEITNG